MLQNSFQFDIFGFINGIFVLTFIIAIVFFIIVILIVYKLLHTNVDNVKEKHGKKNIYKANESTINISKETVKQVLKPDSTIDNCKYCGEIIEEDTLNCPYCGSNLES